MTFEEQFPSLKRFSTAAIDDYYYPTLFNREDIQDGCLDKQRVRDAIEKVLVSGNVTVKMNNETILEGYARALEQELGL